MNLCSYNFRFCRQDGQNDCVANKNKNSTDHSYSSYNLYSCIFKLENGVLNFFCWTQRIIS